MKLSSKQKAAWLMLLCLTCLATTARAQFCNTQEGTKLRYEHWNADKGLKKHRFVLIERVVNEQGRITVDQREFFRDVDDAENTEDAIDGMDGGRFVYDGKGTTQVVLMSGERAVDQLMQVAVAQGTAEERAKMKENMQKMQEHMEAEGELAIPLKEDARQGETFPDCTFKYKLSFLQMTTRIKNGKYEGTEVVNTPAGEFRCLKISYLATVKMAFMSDNTYTTEWYAPGIGLVKSEERDKKGKLLASHTLVGVLK